MVVGGEGHVWFAGGGGHAWLWGVCMVVEGCVVAGGCAWLPGGMHGYGEHVWLLGGMCGCRGVCVRGCGGHVWLQGGVCAWLRGACMVARGHA